ncbi:unnamed protein product [Sympodiomycopsis kandeliae]
MDSHSNDPNSSQSPQRFGSRPDPAPRTPPNLHHHHTQQHAFNHNAPDAPPPIHDFNFKRRFNNFFNFATPPSDNSPASTPSIASANVASLPAPALPFSSLSPPVAADRYHKLLKSHEMGLLDHVNSAVSGAKSAVGGSSGHSHSNSQGNGSPSRDSGSSSQDGPPQGAADDDTEELDEESGNILLSLIGQLRIGMDLSKVTLPTFCLEPRSMLERITDFMSHPDLIFGAGKQEDPAERFLAVTRYYLSGWHIKPKGVKKPYNPVLGEWFQCSYKYPNDTEGFYIAEQVSHHPPISAYYYVSPENDLIIFGELKPKSKFLGNSAATLMGGENRAVLLDRPEDGEYQIGMPNMYARGIMFGRMVLELGDHSKIENTANDITADVEFKTKGYFTGTYNAIAGRVTHKGKHVGDISGKWNEEMDYKNCKSGDTRVLFDAKKATFVEKSVRPESEQEEFESRRLWAKVTEGIKEKNLDKATEAKSAIEDAQRRRTKEREESGSSFKPRFFIQKGEKFYPNLEALPSDNFRPAKAIEWFSQQA